MSKARDRKGSPRWKAKKLRRQQRYLKSLKPRKLGLTATKMFSEAQRCVRKHNGPNRQGFKAQRIERAIWFQDGVKIKGFQSWGGTIIQRGHKRNCNRQVTISGIAFPTRFGKYQSYGGNPNPTYAMRVIHAKSGNYEAAMDCINYDKFIESHNNKINNAIEYYTRENKYHRIYNPNGVSSFWREVPRKRNR